MVSSVVPSGSVLSVHMILSKGYHTNKYGAVGCVCVSVFLFVSAHLEAAIGGFAPKHYPRIATFLPSFINLEITKDLADML